MDKYTEEGLEVDLIKDPETGEYVQFEWRDVVGYEGYYQVSNYGNVKSLDRTIRRSDNGIQEFKGQLKSLRLDALGYLRTGISKGGITKNKLVHRLVAEAFVLNPESKKYVNHKNSQRNDAHKSNLEWCTHAENMKHATESGLVLKGGDNPNAKTIINCRGEVFTSISEASKAFSLKSMTSISNVLSGYKITAGKYPDGTQVHWSEIDE